MTDTKHGAKPTNAQPCELTLTTIKTETCVDTRLLAQHLGNRHQSMFELVRKHSADFEEFGILRFQTGVIDGRGQPEKFALLSEDQCYLLLTYSRNTTRVRQLKVNLIKAFREARRATYLRQVEYLPTYHKLHDEIHALAAESSNEKFVHMNVNKLVNKAVGLEAGQRAAAPLMQQSMLIVAQAVAANALRGATDHHAGYERVKQSLQALTAVTQLEHQP